MERMLEADSDYAKISSLQAALGNNPYMSKSQYYDSLTSDDIRNGNALSYTQYLEQRPEEIAQIK